MVLYNYILFVPEFIHSEKSLCGNKPEGCWVPSRLAAENQAHEALKHYASGMFDYRIIQKDFNPGSIISTGDLAVETCGFYLGKQLLDNVLPCWNKQNLALVYAGNNTAQIKCLCGNFVISGYKYCPSCGRKLQNAPSYEEAMLNPELLELPSEA